MWSTKEAMILAKSDKELLAALPKKPWYPICTDYGLRLLSALPVIKSNFLIPLRALYSYCPN